MANEFFIKYREESWCLESKHHIDEKTRQIFEDLVNLSINYWSDKDIEYFLATEGRLVSKRVELPALDIYAFPNPKVIFFDEEIEKLKKIIVCVYDPASAYTGMNYGILSKILNHITSHLPNDAEIQVGLICKKEQEGNDFYINLLAVFSD
jgi:hypothetical protein